MASSLPNQPLAHFLLLLLLFPLCLRGDTAGQTYHGGSLLTGNVSLSLIWYGRFGRVQKNVIRTFIRSLNYNAGANLQPQVSSWWKVVEGYQEAAGKGRNSINLRVVNQISDANCSAGKTVTADFLKSLVRKVTGEDPNSIPVIFTARDVLVEGLCTGKCSDHGVLGKQPYILVGNPESNCPGSCAWPFHPADKGPTLGLTMNPPSGNVGADAMVIAFARALAEAVTNPYNTGFFQENGEKAIEAASACQGIFGSGAFDGYTGKVRLDQTNGGAFNAYGYGGKKFLVPAIWNPKTDSCWTLL